MSDAVRGLGIMGFWFFLAVLVVAIAWAVVRMAKIRQEALIRIAESGQGMDKDLVERILSPRHIPINKPYDPIRSGNEGAGFFFFIGFCTIFAGIAWHGGISYPMIGLGVFAILWAIYVGRMMGKLDAERRNERKNLEGLE